MGSLKRAIGPAYRHRAGCRRAHLDPSIEPIAVGRDQNLMGPNKGRPNVSIRTFAGRWSIFRSRRVGMVRNARGLYACRIGGLVDLAVRAVRS
jgi:hypothetical protein